MLSFVFQMTETDEPSKIVEVKRVEHAEQLSASEQALQRRGLWKRMSLYSGVFTDESVSSMIVKPFLICVHPAVIWAFLTLAFPVLCPYIDGRTPWRVDRNSLTLHQGPSEYLSSRRKSSPRHHIFSPQHSWGISQLEQWSVAYSLASCAAGFPTMSQDALP